VTHSKGGGSTRTYGSTNLRPPLKWVGGKRWLLPALRELWQGHDRCRLVEPFVGGMSVALGLRPHEALLNDINPHLINFYRWLQKGFVIEIERTYQKQVYYRHRRHFNELIVEGKGDSRRAAELFYYLNRTGYNGLCRFNKKGLYNVPFGRHLSVRCLEDLSAYASVLEGWHFKCADFESLALRPGDFVYADPPYDVEFTAYNAVEFGWVEQVRLAHWLVAHEGPVVASNQATGRVLELYGDLGFEIALHAGPRRISCTGDRKPAQEMLATREL
jgi:DNA adenine methylase